MFWFNSGSLYQIDAAEAIPSPIEIRALTDISVDMSGARKDFNGQWQYPMTSARGDGSIVCKAKFGEVTSRVFSLFLGVTPVTGQICPAIREAAVIPSGHTVTPAQIKAGQTFDTNLGVYLVTAAGEITPMTRAATATGTGVYSLVDATGVYTFAAADTGKSILISYLYCITAATGGIMTITNQLMGVAPKFRAILAGTFDGKSALLDLYNCVSDKFNLATKKGDYANPEIDFAAVSNPAGTIGRLSFAE